MAEEGVTNSQPVGLSPLNGATGLMEKIVPAAVGGQGKSAIIGVAASLLILTGGIIFFAIALGNYANQFGSVPGYAGAWYGGDMVCPETDGYWASEVIAIPNISNMTPTETITAQFTGYHPKNKNVTSNASIEGSGFGAWNSIPLGIGALAVPNNETRFPLGRTVLDIPGVGLRVAVDHGGNIREAGKSEGFPYDHFDLFIGWADNGARDGTNMVPGKVDGVKVYVFPSGNEMMESLIKNYPNQAACIAANSATTGGTGSGDIVAIAATEIGNNNYKKYNGHYRAWCADFVSWVLKQSGANIGQLPSPMQFKSYFSKNGIWIDKPDPSQYAPGDVVVFGGAASNSGTHIGIIESVDPTNNKFISIEGNIGRSKWRISRVGRVKRSMVTDESVRYHTKGIGRFK